MSQAPHHLPAALDLRSLNEDGTLSGYASVFDLTDSYGEQIAPGAFTDSLAKWSQEGRLPAMLWQHNPSMPIGLWTAMREDGRGLWVEGRLARTPRGREAHELLKLGAITGLSIGFAPIERQRDPNNGRITHTRIDLWEVSIVTFPANAQARVETIRAITNGDTMTETPETGTAEAASPAATLAQPASDAPESDLKVLQADLQRQLAELRSYATDQADRRADAIASERIAKLSADIAAKQETLEAGVRRLFRQAEGFEAFMQRPLAGSKAGDDGLTTEALAFERARLAVRGKLSASTAINVGDVDVDGYRAWRDAFPGYLRARDERRLDARAMEVGSDPDGGFLVPTAVSSRILSIIRETSPLRDLATVETIGTDAIEFPVDEEDIEVTWVGELDAPPETATPQIGVQKIEVAECAAQPKATQKLLEDASVDIVGWLTRKLGDAFARKEAEAFLRGDGQKKPRGLMTYPEGEGRGRIQRLPSGHASQIKADALIEVVGALKEAYHAGAVWLMKRSSVTAIMLLKDTTGQYIWRPGLQDGTPQTLLGYPIRHATHMDAVAAGSLPIAFGDFRRAYTVVDRLGITVLRDPYTAKPFIKFYARRRVGGDVVNFEAVKLMTVANAAG